MTDQKETGRFIQNVGSQFITKFVSDKLILNKYVNKVFRGQATETWRWIPPPNSHISAEDKKQ